MKKKTRNIWLAVAAAILLLAGVSYFSYTMGASGVKSPEKEKAGTSTASKSSDSTDETDSGATDSEDSTPAANVPLTEYANQRFGFRVGYPEGWQLTQSGNGDGATAASPDKTTVVYIYGEFTTVFSLTGIADNQTDMMRSQYPDVKTIERKEKLIDDHPVLLVVWQYTRDDPSGSINGAVRNAALITIKGETAIKIECQMPAGQYDSFSPTADAIFNSLRLK